MSNEILNLINQARSQARSEGILNFLNNNKTLLTRLVLVLVVAIISFFGFTAYQKSSEEKYSAILHQSLVYQQVGDLAKAKENLKEIVEASSAPNGVKSLASLRYAAFLYEEGKKEEAQKIYLDVNNCGSCEDYVKDLAGLLAVKTWMTDENELQKPDLANRIEKIENKSETLRYHVAEQRAFLEMQKGNLEKANQIFEMIAKNPEVSQSLKARAVDGIGMVASKGFEPKIIEVKAEEKK